MVTPNQPLVSVIIPTYNHAHFIAESLQSVMDQTYSNWEVWIIDNYSEDDTQRVIATFKDPRIHTILFRNNGIIAASRNEGIRHATGEFIAFLDSDDIWLPTKLEAQLQALQKNKNLLLISTNFEIFPVGKKPFLSIKCDWLISFPQLLSHNRIANSSVLMRRSVVNKIGFLNETKALRAVEDYEYWLKILHQHPNAILILKEVLLRYRVTTTSETAKFSAFNLDRYRQLCQIFKPYETISLKQYSLIQAIKARIILGVMIKYWGSLFQNGK